MDDDKPVSEYEKTQLVAGMFHAMRSKAEGRNYDPDNRVRDALFKRAMEQREGGGE